MRHASGASVRALSDMTIKQADPRWSDLRTRTASALVLAPIAIFCVWQGSAAFSVFLLAACVGLALEWGKLAQLGLQSFGAWLLVAGLGLPLELLHFGVLPSLAAMLAFMVLTWFNYGGFAAAGIPYAGLGALSLLWLRQQGAGLADTIFLVMVVWGTDVGAYVAGRLIGGPKLAPRISPGKTWSGSIGGLLIGAAIGAVLAGGLHSFPLPAFAAGLVLSLCAQGGDLLESAIKRKLGVKDSGHTIPGHGGLFDRLDGFLAAAPVAAWLAFSVHGGVPLWQ